MVDFSPKIGRIDGIDVELHWTFLILLIFILFLSLYLFAIWVLLFACVLLHELVHSITSKRNGIRVKKIVLYPFGGGSIIDFDKVSPEIEFRISIVGPLASLLLAVAFGIADLYAPANIVGSTLQTLFLLNVFLGVFNLLPWLPLDGGRALRSYLQKSRSFLDATRLAVKSSNAVTIIFIMGTVAYAALAHGYSAVYREFIIVWDVAIAFFIYSGAQAEMQSALIKENIKGLRARDAATSNYLVVRGTLSMDKLYKKLMHSETHIVLFRKGSQVKILSSASLQKLLKSPKPGAIIADFGTPIPSIPYSMGLYDAIGRMRSDESNVAALLKGDTIKGILLMQHIEAIIALHISRKKKTAGNSANK
ncbi:MAG: site-2 protease family protein [Candidatus Micrarchaeota archaeon]|nr:site-2 protease family protein [Candidatus Micrarchaeota archaeon]